MLRLLLTLLLFLAAFTGGKAPAFSPAATVTVNTQGDWRESRERPHLRHQQGETSMRRERVNAAAPREGPWWGQSESTSAGSSAAWLNFSIDATLNGNTDHTDTALLVPPSTVAPQYDADGNLTDDGLRTFTWDAESRLLSVTTKDTLLPVGTPMYRATYQYDDGGRRIAQTVEARTVSGGVYVLVSRRCYLYDGWNCVAEYDYAPNGSGATRTLYRSQVWGQSVAPGGAGGLLLIRRHTGPQAGTHIATHDGNGNVTALVNAASGTESARYDYDPFGNLLQATGPFATENPYRFSTQYTDDITGLVYYGYRHYDPAQGRWLSRDPIGEAGGVNLYGMVGNDPVNSVDVLGLEPGDLLDQQMRDKYGLAPGSNLKDEVEEMYARRVIHVSDRVVEETEEQLRRAAAANASVGIMALEIAATIRISSVLGSGITGSTVRVIGCRSIVTGLTAGGCSVVGIGLKRASFEAMGVDYPNTIAQDAQHVLIVTGGTAVLAVFVEGGLYLIGTVVGGKVFSTCSGQTTCPPRSTPSSVPRTTPEPPMVRQPQLQQQQAAQLTVLPNQLPELLAKELAAAARVGARPISPGSASFQQAVNSGTVKFVVTQDGKLLIIPKFVQGEEISHAVLSGGRPVLAAGEAEIAAANGQLIGIRVVPHSGHFMFGKDDAVNALVEARAREAFAQFGIKFPD
jgi:RHS repeat-associated protein